MSLFHPFLLIVFFPREPAFLALLGVGILLVPAIGAFVDEVTYSGFYVS